MDFSSIFMKTTEYLVRRIKKQGDGWNLYPNGEAEAPIFISCQQYAGKMPPKFKFFWQKRKLVLKKYNDFIISAELDGVLLFEVEKEAYPEELCQKIAQEEQWYQAYLEECKLHDEQIKKDLAACLPKLSYSRTLEDDISNLRVPLRAYLKLHLFKGTPSPDSQERLTLMFILCQMAERLYKRHVRETDKKYSLDLSCTFAAMRFSPLFHDGVWPDYHFDMKRMEEAVGSEKSHKVYETYYEAQQLIGAQLSVCSDDLKSYLNFVVRQLLHLYAEDWEELQSHMARDGWNRTRLCSDEEDYLRRYDKMKLLHYTNFILPEEIPQDKIDDFIRYFSLQ